MPILSQKQPTKTIFCPPNLNKCSQATKPTMTPTSPSIITRDSAFDMTPITAIFCIIMATKPLGMTFLSIISIINQICSKTRPLTKKCIKTSSKLQNKIVWTLPTGLRKKISQVSARISSLFRGLTSTKTNLLKVLIHTPKSINFLTKNFN